jgi:endonuclease/exonuclease/phosphatase family metal-dependent hydrolase
MKKLSLFTVIMALISIIGCQKDQHSPSLKDVSKLKAAVTATFTVLSYNVAGLPQALSSAPNRELYTPIIGQKISAYDIVNVQEDFNYHAALYANDTHPYRTATSGGAAIGDGMNTVSNFPFSDDLVRVKWSSCNGTDCLTPKGITWIRMRLAEGVYLDVYNVHTNAGDATADLAARRANIDQLVAYINTNSNGNAFLIFGDTNCRYTRDGDNIRNILTGTGALDSWVQLIKGGTPPALGSATLGCSDLTTVLTSFDCEVVDKIFYRGNNFINLTPLVYTSPDANFRYTDGTALSDHRPAYTKFQYTLSTTLKLSDQFGGPHGTSYNDVNILPNNPIVSILGIRTGSRVDQINIMLNNGTWLTHGGYGGTYKSLTLNSGEYVKSVTMNSGQYNGNTRVFYIKFTTSSGRTLSGGSTTSSSVTYTAPTGWKIVGFHGRSDAALDKMGVIYAPI